MATPKLRKWDSAEHLQTEEDMALYLEACLQEAGDDAAFIAKALGNIARAKGMSQLAHDTGLGRESRTRPSPARQPQLFHDLEGHPSAWHSVACTASASELALRLFARCRRISTP